MAEPMRKTKAEEAQLTLAQRKLAVLGGITKLKKENEARMGKGGSYDYVSHDQVTQMVRPLLADNGIVIEASMQKPDQGWVGIDLTLVNADDAEDRAASTWWVPFPDRMGPQGIGAVLSYAVKYALSKIFLIDAGDEDLDHETHATKDRERTAPPASGGDDTEADVVRQKAKALGVEIMKVVGGDKSAAADLLRDITKNDEKGFEGFRSVNGFSAEWQVDSARKRLLTHPLYAGDEPTEGGEQGSWLDGLPEDGDFEDVPQ